MWRMVGGNAVWYCDHTPFVRPSDHSQPDSEPAPGRRKSPDQHLRDLGYAPATPGPALPDASRNGDLLFRSRMESRLGRVPRETFLSAHRGLAHSFEGR